MKNAVVLSLAALAAASAFAASPAEDWVAVGKSDSETVYLQRTAATIYANGERRTSVKSVFANPREIEGYFFTTMLARLVFDCEHNQSKIVQTDFLDAGGAVVYSDAQPDATFAPITPDSETAFIQGFVCIKKKESANK
jgi:phospholipase/lecithinase/hemolysin